jgi:hypothetical protein
VVRWFAVHHFTIIHYSNSAAKIAFFSITLLIIMNQAKSFKKLLTVYMIVYKQHKAVKTTVGQTVKICKPQNPSYLCGHFCNVCPKKKTK